MSDTEVSSPSDVVAALIPSEEPPPPEPPTPPPSDPDDEPPPPYTPALPEPPGGDGGAVRIFFDDVEYTDCVQSGSVTRTLNRPAAFTLRMFSDCTSVDDVNPCAKVKIWINGILYIHAFVNQISTEAGEDGNLMCEVTGQDPMMLWKWRPARDGVYGASLDPLNNGDTGDFSKPSFMLIGYAPQIMYEILTQSTIDADPADGEGTLFLEFGTFAGGITDVSGMPVDWPMTIAEVFELLSGTGVLDCVLTPIDSGGNMARLDVYNGDHGVNRSSSVVFEYGTGSNNVRALRMTEDSTNVVNKLWYYLGPRVATSQDPAGDQHWRANITALRPAITAYPAYNDFLALRQASRDNCGVRMEIRIYDGEGEDAPSQAVALWERLWWIESWLRAQARTLVHIQPVRTSEFMQLPDDVAPIQVGDFDIGDLVGVTAGPVVRGGFSGAQRVYGYTVNWDEDGVLELGEIQTSADQEGAQG